MPPLERQYNIAGTLLRRGFYYILRLWLWILNNRLVVRLDGRRHARTRSVFSPTFGQFVCLMIAAILLGLSSYFGTLSILNYKLYQAYRVANVIDPLLDQDPLAPTYPKAKMSAAHVRDEDARLMHFAMLHLGLLSDLDNPTTFAQMNQTRAESPAQFEFESVFNAIESPLLTLPLPSLVKLEADRRVDDNEGSTLALVAYLALRTNPDANSMFGTNAQETPSTIADLMAKSLADEGDARSAYTALEMDPLNRAELLPHHWDGWVPICALGLSLASLVWWRLRPGSVAGRIGAAAGAAILLYCFAPMPGSVLSPSPIQRGDQLVRVLMSEMHSSANSSQPAEKQNGAPAPNTSATSQPASNPSSQPVATSDGSLQHASTGTVPLLSTSPKAPEGADLHLLGLTKTLSRLIDQLQADKDVKNWIWWINVIRGPEQLIIMILFFGSGLVLIERWRKANLYRQDLQLAEFSNITDDRMQSLDWNERKVEAGKVLDRCVIAPLPASLDYIALDVLGDRDSDKIRVASKHCLVCRFAVIARRVLERANTGGKDYEESKITLEQLRHERDRLQRDERRARWIIRWMAFAMPAVDFIGTVRGVSAGLGGGRQNCSRVWQHGGSSRCYHRRNKHDGVGVCDDGSSLVSLAYRQFFRFGGRSGGGWSDR